MTNQSNYLETLDRVFDDSGTPSKDRLMNLMEETMSFFRQIKSKLESDDPAIQQEAYEETMEMKRVLESKMQALAEKTGLDIGQLAALAQDPKNMSQEERAALDEAKERLQKFQEETMFNNKE